MQSLWDQETYPEYLDRFVGFHWKKIQKSLGRVSEACQPRRKSLQLAARAMCMDKVGKSAVSTYLSSIFVVHTNMVFYLSLFSW